MGRTLDEKLVVKNLVNGTIGENLCIICLSPLTELYENIFSRICKEDKEYCVADILSTLCKIQLTNENENYNVCVECFISASLAYKFYSLAKRSHKLLDFYTDQLSHNIDNMSIPQEGSVNSLCLCLPKLNLETFDYNLKGVGLGEYSTNDKDDTSNIKVESKKRSEYEDVVVVIEENGESLFYKFLDNGRMVLIEESEKQNYKKTLSQSVNVLGKIKKARKQRGPMSYKKCSQCPVKYRFAAKLQHHMKAEHNINLYICKICKAITEDELEYHNHMKTHTNVHQCAICNTVFKKRDTIIAHLKWHEKMSNLGQVEGAHICEVCGVILDSEQSLAQHWETRHYKKFTCYYCGRMYKGESSFEMHIKKHEEYLHSPKHHKNDLKKKPDGKDNGKHNKELQNCTCTTCGKNFVDQRSLLWHERLHNNERPYKCDVCGRGFVSVNRRNQHAMCTHTAPARRCPLCPALFHLRSMVNTHIKKVHLKSHKLRNRTSKYQNVYWRTEPVPIQELSVSIQNEILELQAAKENNKSDQWVTMRGPNLPLQGEIELKQEIHRFKMRYE